MVIDMFIVLIEVCVLQQYHQIWKQLIIFHFATRDRTGLFYCFGSSVDVVSYPAPAASGSVHVCGVDLGLERECLDQSWLIRQRPLCPEARGPLRSLRTEGSSLLLLLLLFADRGMSRERKEEEEEEEEEGVCDGGGGGGGGGGGKSRRQTTFYSKTVTCVI